MKLLTTRFSRSAAPRAFTIIEIALCLGIIGFALVAIIAVLPRGLDVQKRNREETIISQDSQMWMSALRSGARGYDDLTNYVLCITNFWVTYDANYNVVGTNYDYYTPSNSGRSSINAAVDDSLLTNGFRIIGLLTTPKFVPNVMTPPYQSNYVVCYARAFSGSAVDKVPQTNSIVLRDSFIYRMIVENFPYAPVDTNSFCLDCPAALQTNGMSGQQIRDWWEGRTNLLKAEWLLLANAHDVRLRFRWPVLPNGNIPNNVATFRAMTDGVLLSTNDPGNNKQPLYFVQSSTYVTNSPP